MKDAGRKGNGPGGAALLLRQLPGLALLDRDVGLLAEPASEEAGRLLRLPEGRFEERDDGVMEIGEYARRQWGNAPETAAARFP